MTPLLSPTNTVPPATAGDDSPIALPVAYFQRSFPVARSMATRSPVPAPTYTTSFTMAADESIDSPTSYFHRSLSVAGGAVTAMPVRRGLPRNCGQEPAAGACAWSEASDNRKAQVARAQTC